MFYLWISVSLIATLSITFLTLSGIYFYRSYSNWNVSKGHLIYKVDLVKRKILLLPTNFNTSYNFLILPQPVRPGKWRNLDNLLKNFEVSPRNLNQIKEVLNYASLDNKEKELSFIFKRPKIKNQFLITIKVVPIYDESDFQLHLSWEKMYDKKIKNNLKVITQEGIAKNKKKFKGFVAFYMNSNILNSNEYFLNLLSKILKIKSQYFISHNLIVFTFFSSSSKKNNKKVSKFIELISNKKTILGQNRFFMGTSYALTKNVETLNKLNSFVNFLKFCCFLSSENNEPFISKKHQFFKNEEYLNYLKNLRSLKNAIRSKSFPVEKRSVIDQKTNRKVINYYLPQVSGITKKEKELLLKDLIYQKLITNYFCENILFDKGNDNKIFLIDVYDRWIIENYKQLFLKKVIYVVNIENKRKIPKELVQVLNYLTKQGFVLALKIKKDHITIENLMNSINFKFFIIESDFLSNFSYWKYVDLILVKNTSEKNKVKMIFDGENKHLDDDQRKRIGFRFFY